MYSECGCLKREAWHEARIGLRKFTFAGTVAIIAITLNSPRHAMLSSNGDLVDAVTFVGQRHYNHVRGQILGLGVVVYVYHLRDALG